MRDSAGVGERKPWQTAETENSKSSTAVRFTAEERRERHETDHAEYRQA